MKKIIFPLMVISVLIILYEQSLPKSNLFLKIIGAVIFMFAMMKLSSRTPSKNQDKEDEKNE